MRNPGGWEQHTDTRAFLVALDVSGFSKYPEPDTLLRHRSKFFNAVNRTPEFSTARTEGTVRVHFLGDELRLAFLTRIGPRGLRDFVNGVFAGLDNANQEVQKEHQTRVKGVVFEGVVTWRTWHNSDYLNGALPFKAQRWMDELGVNKVAIDQKFRLALDNEGIPTENFRKEEFSGETGYLLRT